MFTDCDEVRVRSPVGITLSLPFLSFEQLTDYITYTSLFCSALKYWEEINLSKWFFLILKVAQLCPTLCNPMDYNSPWNSPGQNTGVDSLSLLQGIFPTQGSNPGLPHSRRILYQLSHVKRIIRFFFPPCFNVLPWAVSWSSYSLALYFLMLLFSHSVLSNSLWPHGL